MIIENIYLRIINNYEITEKIENNIYFKSINRYLLMLFGIFLFQSIFYFFLFGSNLFSVSNLVMSTYFLALLLIPKKEYVYIHIDFYTYSSFIVLSTFIAIASLLTNCANNVELFYFPILTSIPFFYSLDKKKQIFSIIIYILILFVSLKIFNPFFNDNSFNQLFLQHEEIIKLTNLFFCIVASLVNIYFILEQKENKIKILYEKNKIKENLLHLENKFEQMLQKQFLINNLSKENIEEIYKLAETNSPLYLEKFNVFFPTFKDQLLHLSPNLSQNEIHFCTLIKLNLETKKIAQILNQTVRSVESKKYRLKKKLNLENEINIQEYLIKI